ncbi:MAG: lytic transglycosylase domain-containing protein [Deltaproteobacteria bacterium]|nr:lytic transglycosylase domain-containing protein [Deltaproteobacteria bacterium]
MRQALLLLVMTTSTAALADQQLWIWFDVDGTPNISDRHDDPAAAPFRIGTFEEVALRQQNTPHTGLGSSNVGVVVAPRVPAEIMALVTEMATRHKVPRALLLAVVGVESGFRQSAVSRAGARGLMQLMPATADDLEVDASDARQNVDGGARYLAWLLKYFGDERLALAGYNAGPGRVKRAGNVVPNIKETRAYVDNVRSLRDAFAGAGM